MVGFGDPLLSNTASAALGGKLASRVHLALLSYYTLGSVGLSESAESYNVLNGSARITLQIARRVSLYGEYTRYRYTFGEGTQLPFGFARHLDRQGLRGGLSFSTPLLKTPEAATR
jgi:hypothetical protein